MPPLEEDKLSCAARVEALDRALRAIDGPVILVAHSAGVMMVAHWAQATRSRRPIKGALLATPADVENPFPAGYPTTETLREHGWLPIPRRRAAVPEPARGQPQRPAMRIRARAGAGAGLGQRRSRISAPVGHLNPAAGFGEWPQALELIDRLDR